MNYIYVLHHRIHWSYDSCLSDKPAGFTGLKVEAAGGSGFAIKSSLPVGRKSYQL